MMSEQSDTCRCCTCGHEWQRGRDGSHSCSNRLARRVRELELIIVRARQEFRKGGDPVDCRAWLFRTKIDEKLYP